MLILSVRFRRSMEIQTWTITEFQTAVTHHISKLEGFFEDPKLALGNKDVVFIQPLIHKTAALGKKVN